MVQIKRTQLLVAAALTVGSAPVLAVEFSIEGKLTAFYADVAGTVPATGIDVKAVACNGTLVVLKDETDPAKTVYTTPSSANVPKAAFFSTTALPGYGEKDNVALKDGTCIIEGNSSGTTYYADTFFAEPAENVLVGPVTKSGTSRFEIMGVPVVLLTSSTGHLDPANSADPNAGEPDPERRIVASPPINQFGYPVILSSVPENDLSSAEGYLSKDSTGKKIFYAFAVETTGGKPQGDSAGAALTPTVQRATLEFRSNTSSRMEVRGGCTLPPNVRVQQLRLVVDSTTTVPATGTSPATTKTVWLTPNAVGSVDPAPVAPASEVIVPTATNVTCTEDAGSPGSGTYRFRLDTYSYGGSTGRAAPVNIKVGVPGKNYNMPSVMERIKFP